jgi:hypothetical protein
MARKISLRVDGKLRTVGIVREGIFYKEMDNSQHLMKLLDAYGIDLDVFEQEVMKCRQIRFLCRDEEVVYVVSPREFKTNGIIEEHKPHGKQIFLKRKYFKQEPYVSN